MANIKTTILKIFLFILMREAHTERKTTTLSVLAFDSVGTEPGTLQTQA